jgi:hypothetical protein
LYEIEEDDFELLEDDGACTGIGAPGVGTFIRTTSLYYN